MSSRKRKELRDGGKIYDTPKTKANASVQLYAGYNGGIESIDYCRPIMDTNPFTFKWERQLFRDVISRWEIEVPPPWDMDYFRFILFRVGYLAVIRTTQFGIIPQVCGLYGHNVFYKPTRILLKNPLIKKTEYTIHKDCEIIRLCPDFAGIWDDLHETAHELAEMERSFNVAVINNRISNIAISKNKNGAIVLEEIQNKVALGQPLIVANSANLAVDENDDNPIVELFSNNNYIVDATIRDMMTVYDNFRERWGIPALSEKKERRTNEEVSTIEGISESTIDGLVDNINRSLEDVFRMFPELRGKLSIKLKENKTNVGNDLS